MVIYEAYKRYDLQLDKISSEATPTIDLARKDRLFNIAINRFVKQRYSQTNPKRQGFEVTQKRVEDLENLVKTETIPANGAGIFTSLPFKTITFSKPEKYSIATYEAVECEDLICGGKKVIGISKRRQVERNELYKDPFNKPDTENLFRTVEGGQFIVHYDYTKLTPLNYILSYIDDLPQLEVNKTYTPVDSGPLSWKIIEFPMNDFVVQEIIDIAILLTLESISEPRYNSFTQETLKQE